MRIEGFKVCNTCKIEKSTEEFHLSKGYSFGVSNKCKSCVSVTRKADYYKNQERNIQYSLDYYFTHPEVKEKNKEYIKKNTGYHNRYHKNRIAVDDLYKLDITIRNSIKGAFRKRKTKRVTKKTKKSVEILGCSIEFFKNYIESLWESWMTWENYGNPKDGKYELDKTWDLDHIIPLSSAKTEEDLIRLNHYTNFQPLCSYTNRYIKRHRLL